MNKLSEIYEGWKNLGFPNKETEELAKRRIKICVSCKEFNKRKMCNLCHCYMPAKVRSKKSKCVVNKW